MKKSGPLSEQEQDFIRRSYESMSVGQMAEAINRHESPVRRFLKDEKLFRKLPKTPQQVNNQTILNNLRRRPFYHDLKRQLSSNELRYFQDYWVTLVLDLNSDVNAAEELDLKELLILEILKSRILTESKKCLIDRDRARQNLAREMKLESEEQDKDIIRLCKQAIADSQNYLASFNRDLKDLSDKSNKLKQNLQQTRTQRTEHLEKASIDFKGYIRMLDDIKFKERVGREMEIINASRASKEKELSGYYTYADNKVDRPILNSQTIEQ